MMRPTSVFLYSSRWLHTFSFLRRPGCGAFEGRQGGWEEIYDQDSLYKRRKFSKIEKSYYQN